MDSLEKALTSPLMNPKKSRPETLVPEAYIALLLTLVSKALNVPGDILEVGVYKGGSLFRIAQYIQENLLSEFLHRHLIGIDTFEGHPYINPEKDPPHHYKGRFDDASYETVCQFFSPFAFVDLYKGECRDIFDRLPETQRFCLANLDVDIYESYVRSIEYVYPRLSPGGIMICDEYQGYGQREFIDEYFRDKPVQIRPRTGLEKNYGIIIYKSSSILRGNQGRNQGTKPGTATY